MFDLTIFIIAMGLVVGGFIIGVGVGFPAGQQNILKMKERKRWTN